MENQNNKFLKGIFFILLFFLTILCGMLLKVMADVFKPVVLAVLLSLVFYPLIRRLCLFIKLPWWLSTVIVYIAFFVAFFLRGAADGPSRGRFRLPRRGLPARRKLACFPKASAKVALFPLPAKYFGDYFCENM